MKILTGIVVFIVVAFVGVNVAGNILLGKAMEQTLGVPVKVDRVKLGLFTQEAGIYGLEVQNPETYTEKTLASVPEASISYDLSQIFNKELRIKQITFNLDEITVEKNADGKVNVRELDALNKKSGDQKGEPSEKQEKAEAGEPPIKVIIDEVDLSLGRARYVDSSKQPPTVKEFALEIKNAKLTDVTDPNEVVQQVVMKTLQKVGLNALMPDMGQFNAAFGAQASAKMSEMKEGLGALTNKVKMSVGAK